MYRRRNGHRNGRGGAVVVQFPSAVIEAIVSHAHEAAPRECCGVLVGKGIEIVEAVRAGNLTDDPNRFFLNPELMVSHQLVLPEEGPNDGVVSETSAQYGESTDVWECDHLSLVNWQNPWYRLGGVFSPAVNYGRLLGRLGEEGF